MITNDIVHQAGQILNAICLNLECAESASDPYPLEQSYIDLWLEDTEGMITRYYEGWMYSMPSPEQAARIVAAHPGSFD